jgi:hypothetical protein
LARALRIGGLAPGERHAVDLTVRRRVDDAQVVGGIVDDDEAAAVGGGHQALAAAAVAGLHAGRAQRHACGEGPARQIEGGEVALLGGDVELGLVGQHGHLVRPFGRAVPGGLDGAALRIDAQELARDVAHHPQLAVGGGDHAVRGPHLAQRDDIGKRLGRKVDDQDLVVGLPVVAVDALAVERHERETAVVGDGKLVRGRLRRREAPGLAQALGVVEADAIAHLVNRDEAARPGDVAAGVGGGHRGALLRGRLP